MKQTSDRSMKKFFGNLGLSFCLLIAVMVFSQLSAQNYRLSGRIKNTIGEVIPFAQVKVIKGSSVGDTLKTVSDAAGQYSLIVSGSMIFNPAHNNQGLFRNYPNPFSDYTNIPYRIQVPGWVQISIHDFQGRLVKDLVDMEMEAGEYLANWDGTNIYGSKQPPGIYLVVLTTSGFPETIQIFHDRDGFYGEPMAQTAGQKSGDPEYEPLLVPKIIVTASNYDIKIIENYYLEEGDNTLDFVLTELSNILFKVDDQFFYVNSGGVYNKIIIHGINFGVGTPGKTPGQVNSVSYEEYIQWFTQFADVGFNNIRIYTLHGPQFYRALADYNMSNYESPLYLFQGIWLDEVELDHNVPSKDQRADLYDQTDKFKADIEEVVDCVHGNRNGSREIAYRPGRAYGSYEANGDVSQWTIGYLIGREVYAAEVLGTNEDHPSDNEYIGNFLKITNSSPAEGWLTMNMDICLSHENDNYGSIRPVGFSSWPTLDAITHPYNVQAIEDMAEVDLNKIDDSATEAGVFISYHAYPYFPDFIGRDPEYKQFTDEYGSNAYLGYLHDLKKSYPDKALLIAEYGVPSSWGNARFTSSDMHHGGHTEEEQGDFYVRMFNNIIDADCAGGIAFAQMNEWFKFNWITYNIETYTYTDNLGNLIFSRALWHNQTNPEQNYGFLAFDPVPEPLNDLSLSTNQSGLQSVKALADFRFLNLQLDFQSPLSTGEKIYVSFDTYDASLGESRLPNGISLSNRAEFVIELTVNQKAELSVTQAYNQCGNAPGWKYPCDPNQEYHSTVSNGAPWYLERWITDNNDNYWEIGKLGVRTESQVANSHTAVVFSNSSIDINIPWTMLYFADPSRMAVVHYQGDESVRISDGVAIGVSRNNNITETSRYLWDTWKSAPEFTIRKKAIYDIVKEGIKLSEY